MKKVIYLEQHEIRYEPAPKRVETVRQYHVKKTVNTMTPIVGDVLTSREAGELVRNRSFDVHISDSK